MKYRIQVGQEFDGVVDVTHNEERTGCNEVFVSVSTSKSRGAGKRVAWGVGMVACIITLQAAAFGFATGDFSYLRSIADASNRLAAAVIEAAIAAMRSK